MSILTNLKALLKRMLPKNTHKMMFEKIIKQLFESRRYTEKRLAYHEAGHLVVGYLLDIPCKYIVSKVDMSKPELIGENIICEIVSKAHVYNILPGSTEKVLAYFTSGMGTYEVAKRLGRTAEDVASIIKKYSALTLAGYISEMHFHQFYKIEELDEFDRNTSDNFTQSHEMDRRQLRSVLDYTFVSDIDKNKIIDCLVNEIKGIMHNPVVRLSIESIAEAVYNAKGEKVLRFDVEKILLESSLLSDNDESLIAFKESVSNCVPDATYT